MTERRPHWDDDLIEAVHEAVYPEILHTEYIYAVIAAVEDWAKWEHVPKGTLTSIERVRKLHQAHRCRMSTQHTDCFITYGGECNYADKCAICRTEYPCDTIRTLDGGAE